MIFVEYFWVIKKNKIDITIKIVRFKLKTQKQTIIDNLNPNFRSGPIGWETLNQLRSQYSVFAPARLPCEQQVVVIHVIIRAYRLPGNATLLFLGYFIAHAITMLRLLRDEREKDLPLTRFKRLRIPTYDYETDETIEIPKFSTR